MTSYSFVAYGHPNITATHPTTLQFTKDKGITPKGDCIIGVSANFEKEQLMLFLSKDISITLELDYLKDKIIAHAASSFTDKKDLVIRKSPFSSSRTFATHASKSASKINKKIIEKLKDPATKMTITIHEKTTW